MASKDRLPVLLGVGAILGACLTCLAAEGDAPSAPDPSALFEQARIAEERVVYAQDFEGPGEVTMVQFWGGGRGEMPNKVVFRGPTREQAFSGKRSYKISLTFEPVAGKGGGAYFLLPVEIPAWSDLNLKWHIKTVVQPAAKIHPFHGFTGGNLEGAESHNVAPYVGNKTGEADGWETWEATARKTGKVGERVEGAAVYFQISEVKVPTTVTFFVDDLTVRSRLPVNWQELWADAARYFRDFGEKEKRSSAARRLVGITAWREEAARRRAACGQPSNASPLLRQQFTGTMAKVDDLLAKAAPLAVKIEAGLADEKAPFNVSVNAVERLIFEARHYMGIAEACVSYSGDADAFITFAADPTQCYPILPTGPTAHTDETSYYGWNQDAGSFENPQLLPDVKPVPARPATTLSNFGCRGIYVPYGFAVYAGRDLKKLAFAATDLKSSNGVIPASEADLRILGPWYRPYGGKLRLMNEPLLHDPQFAVPAPGEKRNIFKDPRYGDDATGLLPVTIPAGTTRQFHALVKIPPDAAPGLYKGAIEGEAADGVRIRLGLELEVMPFDLEPTPFAYSAFYRSYLADEVAKKKEGIHSKRKTMAQMEAELINMAEHGLNTLNLYVGSPRKKDDGWDFGELDRCLAMAKRAGLTRSPFTWLGHNVPFIPDTRREDLDTWEEVLTAIKDRVAAANEFCRKRGYPRPAFFGHDERSGEELARLKRGYEAVNKAGGIVTVACYSDYWANVGEAMTLPIVMGGAVSGSARHAIRQSQAAGLEAWIYNCPSTNMPATPSVYRRRYGLALWRLGENGAAPWEYSGVQYTKESYVFEPDVPVYAFAFPTWSGKPIDSIIFEAYREGIYDTRYMATLENHLKRAKDGKAAPRLVAKVEKWLASFSVHDDLWKVRRQMAGFVVSLQRQMQE